MHKAACGGSDSRMDVPLPRNFRRPLRHADGVPPLPKGRGGAQDLKGNRCTRPHAGRTDSRMTGVSLSPASPSFPVMIVVHEYSREEIFLGTTHPSPVAFAGRHLPAACGAHGKALREDSSCYLHPRGLRKPFVYNRRATLLICLPL